jgi:hypothetical protein
VAASGTSGGLALAWCPGVELEWFASNKNSISTWYFSNPPHSPWVLSCVYGLPNRRDRRDFWDSFATIGERFEASWLCIGDFNSVVLQTEKSSGIPVDSSSHCPFRNFIDHFDMIDVGFVGNPFTWSNSRHVAPQILIVLFLIYLFDNIIQLISLRNLWYYGGW